MDSKRRLVWGAMITALPLLAASATALGDEHSPRQYYGAWEHHRTYSYRSYYYKPTPTYAGYRHHYVISYPSDHQHYYYYNPYKRTFWGRCDAYGEGQPYYSRLPEEFQRPTLAEIPESAFPTQGPLPSIPDAEDGSRLDLPPDDGPRVPVVLRAAAMQRRPLQARRALPAHVLPVPAVLVPFQRADICS